MAAVGEILLDVFPNIDEQLFEYIQGLIESGKDDFSTRDDVYEAVGDMLHEVSSKSLDDSVIQDVCERLLKAVVGDGKENGVCQTGRKVLGAPVMMGEINAGATNVEDAQSIWMKLENTQLQVDSKKLEKAEAKIRAKQEKRDAITEKPPITGTTLNNAASAAQAVSKRDAKMDSKSLGKSQDIRIENFDVAFGEKMLLSSASVTLVYGRRYGLVGRNGIGKTTLLRMISTGQLRIPPGITVLHVEQEVVGDDTLALDSVLECDEVRNRLLKEEKELTEAASSDASKAERLAQVYVELQVIEADKAPSRASVILNGLGFSPEMQRKATREFSGGWRMRIALARALFTKPDLLLLDEPTNMLDMKAIIWLENYLQAWQSTLLVVSHDRQFLDSVPTDILHFHSQRIEAYRGNYDTFVKTMTEKMKNQQREYEAQQQLRQHAQVFIDRFRFNAKRASLVQSKIKQLEKLPELQPVEKNVPVVLRFQEPEQLFPPILQLDEVSFRYAPDQPFILKNVDLSANMQSRICIVGDNGSGKTTLLKILTGDLEPTSGIRHVHRNLVLGYFSQHHVDQLEMNLCPVEFLASKFPGKPSEVYRAQLGSFGVTGDLALQSVASLSGGQKSRVAFAAMAMTVPHFLILDEPTNHLDIETIEALGNALNKFAGGVVLVSHDERLIQLVCKELWLCSNGSVRSIEGGFEAYRRIVETELAQQS